MRTYEEHLAAVRAALPARRVEACRLAKAPGRTLARTITARRALPHFDNSQMDGYALTTTEGGTFRVGRTIAAGDEPRPLEEGCATPIMTGARVPENTACIVPVEHCQPPHFPQEGEQVTVPAAPHGQFIRKAGSDTRAGEILAPAGTRISPAVVGTLALQGIEEVQVFAPARILVCTGGAEIGGSGSAQIPDANAPLLAAMAQDYGIEVAGYVRTNDDPQALRAALHSAVRQLRPDAIVTSGGISHGKFEVIRQIFAESGWFGHVAQQPGGPQGLSRLGAVPVLSLPGNPISTLVSFRLYVAPLLGSAPQAVTARLAHSAEGLSGREQFRRGVLEGDSYGTLRASLHGGAGSHLLSQAIGATALIRIPAHAHLSPGDTVEVFPLL
ncbi:molybdopterin molybdotransferase MoeA [Corynebacterium sp.]|uniref:molybdopterin molybdotransferase MoeA n=1 Tax=Corynebacterium sp. TaxID=1720 RepID=UPI0026DD0248|nr:molybdopterin molybdotransferase MoeA [Corynebacterium sp.]MDO5032557.1 molybdopterin molybdotransferase MoeA [Corynebacterium sp.]